MFVAAVTYPLTFLAAALFSLPMDRRTILSSIIVSPITTIKDISDVSNANKIDSIGSTEPWSIILPLEHSSGGTNSVRVTLSYKPTSALFGSRMYIPKKIYKVIVDTGSPYLVIADGMEYASYVEIASPTEKQRMLPPILEYISGLLEEEVPYQLKESSYGPTEEIYGSKKGSIEWRESLVQLRDERLTKNIVVGVLDKGLTEESGGPLLGLVKNSNYNSEKVQLRPTFLEQEGEISSFQIDSPNRQMTLASGKSLIPNDTKSVIPMVDLRPLGDFVEHYACNVKELQLDGTIFTPENITSSSDGRMRRIVAVFDSGLTGCLLTQPLWDALQQKGMNLSRVKSIDVGVCTEHEHLGKHEDTKRSIFNFHADESKNPFFNLSPISLDWFDEEESAPYVVVLGQTFLTQGILTVDIDDRRATFVVE